VESTADREHVLALAAGALELVAVLLEFLELLVEHQGLLQVGGRQVRLGDLHVLNLALFGVHVDQRVVDEAVFVHLVVVLREVVGLGRVFDFEQFDLLVEVVGYGDGLISYFLHVLSDVFADSVVI